MGYKKCECQFIQNICCQVFMKLSIMTIMTVFFLLHAHTNKCLQLYRAIFLNLLAHDKERLMLAVTCLPFKLDIQPSFYLINLVQLSYAYCTALLPQKYADEH